MIEQMNDVNLGSRVVGVRIGAGSMYDWVVEEILAGGAFDEGHEEGDDMAGGAAMMMAMKTLAEVRKRRVFTREVEAAFDQVERELGAGRRPGAVRRRAKRNQQA